MYFAVQYVGMQGEINIALKNKLSIRGKGGLNLCEFKIFVI